MMNKSKKAQGMSTSTIILLIIGIIVLVVLVWGFVTGWSTFKDWVNPTNVDGVVQACTSACSVSSTFSYCRGERSLRVNEDDLNVKSSCLVFSTVSEFAKYNIPPCPTIDCGKIACTDITINGKNGQIMASAPIGIGYDVTSISDAPSGQVCVVQK